MGCTIGEAVAGAIKQDILDDHGPMGEMVVENEAQIKALQEELAAYKREIAPVISWMRLKMPKDEDPYGGAAARRLADLAKRGGEW